MFSGGLVGGGGGLQTLPSPIILKSTTQLYLYTDTLAYNIIVAITSAWFIADKLHVLHDY